MESNMSFIPANTGNTPASFNKMSENTMRFPVISGTFIKARIRPAIINEHVESSRVSQGTVTPTNKVGQIFKASEDNINGAMWTLSNAATVTVIDNIEEATNVLLQAAWVLLGTNLATLSTANKSPNNGSTKSMQLMDDFLADTWTNTFIATDMTGGSIEFDWMQDKESVKTQFSISITDGINVSTVIISVPKIMINVWRHFSIPVASFVGLANVLAITGIQFSVTLSRGGQFGYADNVQFRPAPKNYNVALYDMGATLPVAGTTTIGSGTVVNLGDLGITGTSFASLTETLDLGTKLYKVDSFSAGAAVEHPSNVLLTVGHYYAIVWSYVDTNYNVMGTDPTFGTNYYPNGFAFTAPDLITPITAVGVNNDCMFVILSTQDVYVNEISYKLYDSTGASVNGGLTSSATLVIEGSNMEILSIAGHERTVDIGHEENYGKYTLFAPKGSKGEVYYTSEAGERVAYIDIELNYNHE